MNNLFSNQLSSNSCPPCPSDDSLFFNLILGINYENTKENCYIFLKNYSRQYSYQRRDLFIIIINQLVTNEYPDKMAVNNESVYLVRQLIKKYTKNNILNALYEFISEKEESLPQIQDKNDMNCINDISLANNDNYPNNKISSKENKKINNKEKEKYENNELSTNIQKITSFLSKKRSSQDPQKKTEEKRPETTFKISKMPRSIKEENNSKKESEKEKIDLVIDENDDEEIIEEEDNESLIPRKKNKKLMSKNKGLEEKAKCQHNNKENIEEKNKGLNKEEKENSKIKQKVKEFRPISPQKFENRLKSMSINNIKYYMSLIHQNNSKQKKTKLKEDKNRSFSLEEVIKLDSSDELVTNNSHSNSQSSSPKKSEKKIHNLISKTLSSLNLSESQEIRIRKNKFGNHFIKYTDNNNNSFVYSYVVKRYKDPEKQIIIFRCNNRKCKGKGEYSIEQKRFKVLEEHDMQMNLHNIAVQHYCIKDALLNDGSCNGYQLIKDINSPNDFSYIKDKKVIMINH